MVVVVVVVVVVGMVVVVVVIAVAVEVAVAVAIAVLSEMAEAGARLCSPRSTIRDGMASKIQRCRGKVLIFSIHTIIGNNEDTMVLMLRMS